MVRDRPRGGERRRMSTRRLLNRRLDEAGRCGSSWGAGASGWAQGRREEGGDAETSPAA
jgi:hypothetical protein